MNSPSSAIRDTAELLNVHMHQLTRSLFLVANGPRFSDWQAGRLIEICQERHSVACDHALDRGPRDTQVITDLRCGPQRRVKRRLMMRCSRRFEQASRVNDAGATNDRSRAHRRDTLLPISMPLRVRLEIVPQRAELAILGQRSMRRGEFYRLG